ncbi:RNA polymerase sigma factor [Snuella sedimenti]|uniref:Sigma-70 family RNA polymerase sigma factor n=1 Tax=Snuella sedimenti TaxID=2798802 RepID=A0A8J7LRN9_9FLAO|nr:sigma-70 family RNA polymerase sigma factor [Snuella sedimenti]MBJ6366681.1 sigma-70 family RNA polymerase sigma factor [Snuella sedimenti]
MYKIYQDNAELVKDLKNGRENAYSFLIHTYHKKLFVYALSLTNDQAMTQDIIQNVFLRTWEFRDNLKADFSIKGFLYKSVYNEFINQYHRNQSISVLEKVYVEAITEEVNDFNQELFEKKMSLINKEIEGLPSKCKQTFLLSKKEGLTNIEIAEYLNVSLKTVEAHITKAYSIIRKRITKKTHSVLFLLFGIRITS